APGQRDAAGPAEGQPEDQPGRGELQRAAGGDTPLQAKPVGTGADRRGGLSQGPVFPGRSGRGAAGRETLSPPMRSAALLGILAAFLGCAGSGDPAGSPAQVSELWGRGGERWSPRSRLPDFSFAGYHFGDDPIPD